MVDSIRQFVIDSIVALIDMAQGLWMPALFFFVLGFLVKGKSLFTDIRRALPESAINFQLIAFNLVFTVPVLVLIGSAVQQFYVTHGFVLIQPQAWVDSLHPAIVILFAVTIGDFVGYWRHRLEHSPLLWPAHAVHHSDTELSFLSLERFHPINRVTTYLIDASALLILGLPAYAVIANSMVRHYYGMFIHADLPWTYGPLARIFVSPAMHRWHHSLDQEAFNTNYATVYSIWDRAFGTYRVPGPCTSPLGVTDDMAQTFWGQLKYAFEARAYRRFWTQITGRNKPVEPAE